MLRYSEIYKYDTYWGRVEVMVDTDHYCAKRLYMRAGSQSSMEYHVTKHETYYIESGTLLVGLRNGRAVPDSIIVREGNRYEIPPGTMHMRMALTDVTILEVSTADIPGDTHFVEDGKTYTHPHKGSTYATVSG